MDILHAGKIQVEGQANPVYIKKEIMQPFSLWQHSLLLQYNEEWALGSPTLEEKAKRSPETLLMSALALFFCRPKTEENKNNKTNI